MTPLTEPIQPGPPDEASRKELERLEKVLAGGKWRFLLRRSARGVILAVLYCVVFLAMPSPSSARWLMIVMGANLFGLVLAAIIVFTYVWPLYVSRAAAIRAGASYAAPSELKDCNIFMLSSLALALLCCGIQIFLREDHSASEAIVFLSVASIVTGIWAVVKGVKGFRRCPAKHLRRREIVVVIILSLLGLFVSTLIALLPALLGNFLDRFVLRPVPVQKALRVKPGDKSSF